MSQELILHGQTFKEFCDNLFESEYCAECHGDTPNHEPNILMGNWFARCIEILCSNCHEHSTGGDESELCLHCWNKEHNMGCDCDSDIEEE